MSESYYDGLGLDTDTEQILADLGTQDYQTAVPKPEPPPVPYQEVTAASYTAGNVPSTFAEAPKQPMTIFGVDAGLVLGYAASAALIYWIFSKKK